MMKFLTWISLGLSLAGAMAGYVSPDSPRVDDGAAIEALVKVFAAADRGAASGFPDDVKPAR